MFERNDVDMWLARVISLETQHRNLDDTALQVMRMQRTVLSHSLVHSRIASRHVTKSAQRRANCASTSIAMILGSHAAPAWEVPHTSVQSRPEMRTCRRSAYSQVYVQEVSVEVKVCVSDRTDVRNCIVVKPPSGKSPRTSATRWVSS